MGHTHFISRLLNANSQPQKNHHEILPVIAAVVAAAQAQYVLPGGYHGGIIGHHAGFAAPAFAHHAYAAPLAAAPAVIPAAAPAVIAAPKQYAVPPARIQHEAPIVETFTTPV